MKDMLTLLELAVAIGAGLAGYVLAMRHSEKKTLPMVRSVAAIRAMLIPPDVEDSEGAVEKAVTPLYERISNIDGTLADLRESHRIQDRRMVQIDEKLLGVEHRMTSAANDRAEQRQILQGIDGRLQKVEQRRLVQKTAGRR